MQARARIAASFYIDDHALLYAYLLKSAEQHCADKGLEASGKGTVLYARERGLRMAMRCLADNRPLTPRNYLIYGEWVDDRKWSDLQPGGLAPFVLNFNRCGWNETWKKHGLEKYGAVYCSCIDQEIVTGFNPENGLRVDKTRPQGHDICSFGFLGADFASEEELKKDGELKAQLRPWTVKDFLFHTAHLFSALRRAYLVELGLPKTGSIVADALALYTEQFGQEKRDALLREAEQDFLTV